MSKSNDIPAKIDRLKQRIDELVGKSGSLVHGQDDTWGGDSLTKDETQELTRLYGKLEQLIKKDDKAVGL